MKKTCVLLLLLAALPLTAFAATADKSIRFDRSERVTELLASVGDLRRVIAFDDGSQFFIHGDKTPTDSKGMSAVLLTQRGDIQRFSAAALLPPGSIKAGLVGQIYCAAPIGSGELALSVGYVTADGRVTNAVLLLALREGAWTTTRVIDFPYGVRDVAAGPEGTILAVTTDLVRLKKDGTAPLVTVIDRTGRVAGELFDVVYTGGSVSEAARNAQLARLQALGDAKYAIFDGGTASVRLFELARTEGGRFDGTVRKTISVAAVPEDVSSSRINILKGVHVDREGKVHVARSYVAADKAASIESIYGADGSVEHQHAPRAYTAVYWVGDTTHGIGKE